METRTTQRIITDDLSTWIESFLFDRKAANLAPGTLQFYQVKAAAFLRWCDGQQLHQVNQVDALELRRFLVWLAEQGHTPGGVHAFFRFLRAFFLWLADETDDPAQARIIQKVKAPVVPEELQEPLSLEHLAALLAACGRDQWGSRDKAILLTLYDTGLRASELCALDLADVDFTAGALTVQQGKGRKPRTVFFGRDTRRALRAWLKRRGLDPGPLFVSRWSGDHLTYDGLRSIIQRRAALAGIDAPGLHDFRRAFCLAQLQAGTPETVIARYMGHASTALISKYAKQTPAHLQELYTSPVDARKRK